MNRLKLPLLVAAALLLARPASAQHVIVETATYDPGGIGSWQWALVGRDDYYQANYWILATFHLDVTTHLTRVGIANVTECCWGPVSLYAAVIRVTPDGLPVGSGEPVADDNTLAHTVFVPDGTDQRIPLDVTLPPGDYGVIFGGGRWGATGTATVYFGGQTLKRPTALRLTDTFIFGLPVRWPTLEEWQDRWGYGPPGVRITVEADVDIDTVMAAAGTRASQASLDALAATLDTLATGRQVTELAASIGGLGTAVQQLTINVTGLATPTDVRTAALGISGGVASRASQSSVDTLASTITSGDDRSQQTTIERALANGTRLASLFLPEAYGGCLERVRDTVERILIADEQAGRVLPRARKQFDKGDGFRLSNDWKNAFDAYANAYQALVK